MSKCKQCNVIIKDNSVYCPLCNSVLERENKEENFYPNVRRREKKIKLIVNIYSFVGILFCLAMLYINYFMHVGKHWSVAVTVGVIYGYGILRIAVLSRNGYRSKIILLNALALILLIVTDISFGYRGWSMNYVFPGIIIVMNLAIIILMIINKRNWQSYMMFQLFTVLISLLTLIFLRLKIVTKPECSVIAFIFSVSLFMGTLIIGDKKARRELYRRFHIR